MKAATVANTAKPGLLKLALVGFAAGLLGSALGYALAGPVGLMAGGVVAAMLFMTLATPKAQAKPAMPRDWKQQAQEVEKRYWQAQAGKLDPNVYTKVTGQKPVRNRFTDPACRHFPYNIYYHESERGFSLLDD